MHINSSKYVLRHWFLSRETNRPEEINSRCLLIQSVAAGNAMTAPFLIYDADRISWVSTRFLNKLQNASLISHQTGAESLTLPAHTIALTPLTRQCSKNHKIIAMEAMLRALICRGSGISTRTAAMNARAGSSG